MTDVAQHTSHTNAQNTRSSITFTQTAEVEKSNQCANYWYKS